MSVTSSAAGTITGWGTALPDKVVTNDDLADYLDTSNSWIVERTGIRERRIAEGPDSTARLAAEAGQNILASAGLDPSDIDLLILATSTPDQQMPATASQVQNRLGLTCGAFDLNAACSGFVYSLITAFGFIRTGAERVLLIGSETMSRIVDWNDRGTCILFADGAAGVVIEARDGPGQLLGWHLYSDGTARSALFADHGGKILMEGREVFRRAVKVVVESAEASLARAGLSTEDVDVVIPHQANVRIVDSAMRKLGIPNDRAVTVLETTGNTSAASIPLALAKAMDTDRISPGAVVLTVGFGAGLTAASAVLRW